ncbi:MAG: hypothetical protein A2418_03205 [Candidatus Brennerbacteria bacterium RIFOXYC1_FULL_41_11]|uniref:SMC-Scp complex subunit ScpB n=1 Tax=Candidatus Brennerbacteria bacterium RIFOXYD1_FULL_41_16 TaxID=1797529 RepID=A0A1G1XKD4_9BACT|nr:MAG: hypothetical protein A2391_00810 [Candidatus Brennerbacteria bacterium RIFOXYB1_FULL_41_13]OGY39838.1 MAG: hypothetical protein A2418_03205 [Candidatus Brennerbacteria bacterium RIFOXYC1_FULL_41_11]OGY40563.1 MAG: hypothetical protein A2570_02395 [Candidatus Brennerbacteria bacterium RIFOXYD1_FULL_41_16]
MEAGPEKSRFFSALESILFAYGEPVKLDKLAVILGLEQAIVNSLVVEYAEKIAQNLESGTVLIRNNDEIQLGTRPGNFVFLEKFLKRDVDEELSSAATEVLTLILYRGPILRSEIDFIRGVNSSYILRMLSMRDLITREKHGLSFVYRPSFGLLKLLGILSPEDLPDFDALNQRLGDLMKKVENFESEIEKDHGTEQ